jgi:hypothetical protein
LVYICFSNDFSTEYRFKISSDIVLIFCSIELNEIVEIRYLFHSISSYNTFIHWCLIFCKYYFNILMIIWLIQCTSFRNDSTKYFNFCCDWLNTIVCIIFQLCCLIFYFNLFKYYSWIIVVSAPVSYKYSTNVLLNIANPLIFSSSDWWYCWLFCFRCYNIFYCLYLSIRCICFFFSWDCMCLSYLYFYLHKIYLHSIFSIYCIR